MLDFGYCTISDCILKICIDHSGQRLCLLLVVGLLHLESMYPLRMIKKKFDSCNILLKAGGDLEIVNKVSAALLQLIPGTVIYIKVYISGMERTQSIKFFHQISLKMLFVCLILGPKIEYF